MTVHLDYELFVRQLASLERVMGPKYPLRMVWLFSVGKQVMKVGQWESL